MKRSHPICHHCLNTWNQSFMVALMVGGQFSPSYFHFKKGLVWFCVFTISSNYKSECIGKVTGYTWCVTMSMSLVTELARSDREELARRPESSGFWPLGLLPGLFPGVLFKVNTKKGYIVVNFAFKVSEANWHYRKHQKKRKEAKGRQGEKIDTPWRRMQLIRLSAFVSCDLQVKAAQDSF